jgi:hypothetical protein
MLIKRWIVALVSVAVGAALTVGIITLHIPLGPITIGFGTSFEFFAYSNVALLFISLACITAIWLDYFLDTKILKS